MPAMERPENDDCRVFRADAAGLKAGHNTVTVENTSDRVLEITRVNLGLW